MHRPRYRRRVPHPTPARRPNDAVDGGGPASLRKGRRCLRRPGRPPAAELRPTLNTASSNDTLAGRAVREAAVNVVSSGIHSTTSGRSGVSIRTAWVPAVATTPPYSEAATLSAWPSRSAVIARTSACRSANACWPAPLHHGEGGAADPHRPAESETATNRDRGAHPHLARPSRCFEGDPRRVMLVDPLRQRRLSGRLGDDADLGVHVEGDTEGVEPRPEIGARSRNSNDGHAALAAAWEAAIHTSSVAAALPLSIASAA